MKKAVLSLSGGMDSTSLLIHLLANNYEVKAYSFNYGQKHIVELKRVKDNLGYLRSQGMQIQWSEIDLKSVFCESQSALTSTVEVPKGHYEQENMKLTVVENRNAIFSSIIYGKALSWANQSNSKVDICLGIHSGDHHIYKDCRPEFRDALNKAFKIGNDNSEAVDFYTPYLKGNKESILRDCRTNCDTLNISFDTVLKNTNTCYDPNHLGLACGKCGACIERVEAFINIDRIDPVKYMDPWKDVMMNTKKMLKRH